MSPLAISANHRYLVHADRPGQPFFYLGDTAWELFHRLNREEADHYLETRARQRFTVIQAVILAEFDGLTVPNSYGHLPLKDMDPTQPIDDYFQHVDYIIHKANSLGLYVGLLPTWGDKVNKKWGAGPEIFTPDNAAIFGGFLARRYRDADLIWILGGDRPVENDTHLAIWRNMAAGIQRGDAGRHLITFHPQGQRSSSQYVHNESWLDFNMLQSGHQGKHTDNHAMVAADYARTPVKPTLDAEPAYEDHPIWPPAGGLKAWNGEYFDPADLRRRAYWALCVGACGHTYGCHDIWQMLSDKHPPVNHARTPWRDALHLPAAGQMQHLRSLMESRPMLARIPNDQIVQPGSPRRSAAEPGERICALASTDQSHAIVYIPVGQTIEVDLTCVGPRARAIAWWYNPRDGSATSIGERTPAHPNFTPPTNEDWVLVLDDPSRRYAPPGQT